MTHDDEDDLKVSYWPSVSDLFLTLFIVGIVLMAVVVYVLTPKSKTSDERAVIEAVGTDLKKIRDPVNHMRGELTGKALLRDSQSAGEVVDGLEMTSGDVVSSLQQMKARLREMEMQVANGTARVKALETELNDKPPIIRIEESRLYRFDSGSAIMSETFRQGLAEDEFRVLADEIIKRNGDGRRRVDTLEVIGHTDGRPLSRRGNLDDELPDLLGGGTVIAALQPGSNNDLGLLRALALKQAWETYVAAHPRQDLLRGIKVRCYSAGQTLPEGLSDNPTTEDYRKENGKSRRIEIRLTKLAP